MRPSSAATSLPIHVPQHAVTMTLTAVISVCSVVFGLMTHENIELLGARGDLTPLYISLGPSWWTMPLKLVVSQLTCLSPGELVLSVVGVAAAGRLDRLLGLARLCGVVAVLMCLRCLTVVAWCALVSGASLLEVRVRPSVLWLCVSVAVMRSCLVRSDAQVLLGRFLPVNAYPMLHVTTLLLVSSQRGSIWDTTLPAACFAALVCTEIVGVHRWSWCDYLVSSFVRWVAGGRRLTSCLRKSIRFPSPSPDSALPVPAATGRAHRTLNSRDRSQHRDARASVRRAAETRAAPAQAVVASGDGNAISGLIAMGFSERDSASALTAAGGDVNLAAVLLLDGHTVEQRP